MLHSRTARANPDATSGALKTVRDVGSWAEGSIPEDIEAVYDTSRYVAEVVHVDEPREVFEFKLGKGSSFVHSSGVFLDLEHLALLG